ncbi:hypothetical protein Ato02nite_029110 [Paractinoplanes toevensis]|uniref:Uncharacterized protein n=1 Tax=Paractinoplanes toevensis TaxID=571911 RepID=A0A919T8K9_9ACTN|nr:hypothetical protein Ato02nite_029110 [Actinoplanes toevensis]
MVDSNPDGMPPPRARCGRARPKRNPNPPARTVPGDGHRPPAKWSLRSDTGSPSRIPGMVPPDERRVWERKALPRGG